MKKANDQHFDSLMHKFANNIYGSSKGKLRHELLLTYLQQCINLQAAPLQILDVGGGTGIMSGEMAQLGHRVNFTDASLDAVQFAEANLADLAGIEFSHTDLLSLPPTKHYELVMCHAVLEWLSDPYAALERLIALTAPDGYLSVSFFNRDAHQFGNLLYGNFDYVNSGMKNKNTVRLNPKNSLFPRKILSHLAGQPVDIIHTAGLRCIHDYLQDRSMQQSHYAQLKQAELKYGPQEPYKWLGKYFHIIVKKRSC